MDLITALGMASAAFVAWFTWRQFYGHDDGRGAQSRRESIIEAWTNIVIGFSINYVVNIGMLPLMTDGGHLSMANNFWGGWCFTVVSICRQFLLRRAFNSRAFAEWLAKVLSFKRSEPPKPIPEPEPISKEPRDPMADEEMA